jgi:hypothetical protein
MLSKNNMKIILSFLAIILITKDCNNIAVSRNTQEQDITITYQASSRGSFEEITVSKDSFSISTDRTRKDITFYKTPSKDWDESLKLLEVIELNQLPNLKAPTSMRQYDGAAHAALIIKNNKEKIQSSSFDHGYPPEEIKPLVEKLLSFKKLASKQ